MNHWIEPFRSISKASLHRIIKYIIGARYFYYVIYIYTFKTLRSTVYYTEGVFTSLMQFQFAHTFDLWPSASGYLISFRTYFNDSYLINLSIYLLPINLSLIYHLFIIILSFIYSYLKKKIQTLNRLLLWRTTG